MESAWTDVRRKAAEMLDKDLEHCMKPAKQGPKSTTAEMRHMLFRMMQLASENKINEKNAFDQDFRQFIDTLPDLILQERGVDHFQQAGMGLDVGTRIYAKRVDAISKFACRRLGMDDEDTEEGGRDQEPADAEPDGAEQAEGDTASAGPDAKRRNTRRRQVDGDPGCTLEAPEKLRSRATEPTFDTDPFFTKTSRLFDDNSASSLLQHNLLVRGDCSIMFNADEVAGKVPAKPGILEGAANTVLDLTCMSQCHQLLEAACHGTLVPSVGMLYDQLQPQGSTLPGLAAVQAMDVAGLLAEACEHERVVCSQRASASGLDEVVDEVMQDAMQDAMQGTAGLSGEAGASAEEGAAHSMPADDSAHGVPGEFGSDDDDGGGGDYGFGGDDAMPDDEDWAVGSQGGASASVGGAPQASGLSDGENETAGVLPTGSMFGAADDVDAVLRGMGQLGLGLESHKHWAGPAYFKLSAKGKAALASKARVRRAKEVIEVDFDATPPEIELVPVSELCYKKRRPKVVRNFLPMDYHVKPSNLERFSATNTTTESFWRARLIELQRQKRKAAAVAHAAPTAEPRRQVPAGLADDTRSGLSGSGGPGSEEGYGDDAGYGGDSGYGGGGEYDEGADDEQDQAGMGELSLEDLLAPPKRVPRNSINYAANAKHVDVKRLKDDLYGGLVSLSAATADGRSNQVAAAGQAGAEAGLPFQQLLDELPKHSKADAASLANVSVHLGFICVLHLANEHGLKLSNCGRLDTLRIAGLQGLASGRQAMARP